MKVPMLQQVWTFVKFVAWFVHRWRYNLGILAAYAGVVAMLSIWLPTHGMTLYLAIWTLCFMPMIYEIRQDRVETYPVLGDNEEIFLRITIAFVGLGISLYPALQPIFEWPSCVNYANGTLTC